MNVHINTLIVTSAMASASALAPSHVIPLLDKSTDLRQRPFTIPMLSSIAPLHIGYIYVVHIMYKRTHYVYMFTWEYGCV